MTGCIFCQIVKGEIPTKFEYNLGEVVAFPDINPRAPLHFLIVPKKHILEFAILQEEEKAIWEKMIKVAGDLIEKHGLKTKGYRLVVNGGGAALINHLHLHLLGGITAAREV